MPAASSTARPSAVTRRRSSVAYCQASWPHTASVALLRLASSLPYFHRITSAVTGARKRLAVRSAPICSAVASVPDGYRPRCSRPASGAPFASTVPGFRWVAGSHTHIPYTWRKRRSAIRSLATPFCAHTTGSAPAATAPPRTGCQAHSASNGSASWVLVARMRTSSSRRPSSPGPPIAGMSSVDVPSGVARLRPRAFSAPRWRPRATRTTSCPPTDSRPPMVPPIAPAPMTMYRIASILSVRSQRRAERAGAGDLGLRGSPQELLNLPSSPAVSVVPLTAAWRFRVSRDPEVSPPHALPQAPSADAAPVAGPGRGRWEFWRSPDGQPPWARPALLGIAAVAALLYARNLAGAGLAPFYSVAVKSMSVSWKAFFYGAFDPKATITIDKLAGSFLPQALSARFFGFHPWSLALPQVIEGVVSVLVMYRVVRRWAGPVPGLLAAGIFAATPIAASMFGHSMEDGFLTMCLVLAADSWQRAMLDARLRSLMWSGVWVGVGFQAKMLQAWVILPALALGYLLAAPVRLRERLWHLGAAGAVMLAVSLSWIALYTVTPAADRPYVDGSTDNSAVAMVCGYNGVERVGISFPGSVASFGGGGGRGGGPVGRAPSAAGRG